MLHNHQVVTESHKRPSMVFIPMLFKDCKRHAVLRMALLGGIVLSAGCQQVAHTNQRQPDTLVKEREQISQQQKELTELHQELDAKLALLDTEKKLVASSRVELEQERRKLEVIRKSINSTKQQPRQETATKTQKIDIESLVIGQLEHVIIMPPGIELKARIDTGAQTSSLNALDLTEFERDGKPHVRFNIIDPKTGKPIELVRQIRKHTRIKEHDNESQRRPVVKMRVILGSIDQRVSFTLIDRSNFKHQVLIGRNFLRDFAVVDVSKRYTTTPKIP